MEANRRIEDDQEEFAEGHITQYSVEFTDFLRILPLRYKKSFNFLCNVLPTAWSFEVTFERNTNDDSVSCSVVIKRYDSSPVNMDFGFWMKVLAAPFTGLEPIAFNMQDMPGAHQIKRTFREVLSPEAMENITETVLVQVSFGVNGCHKEKDMKKRRNRRDNREHKALFSKM